MSLSLKLDSSPSPEQNNVLHIGILNYAEHRLEKLEFEKIYADYAHAIYGVILRIVKFSEVAEDVLQETFVKVWKNYHQYDDAKGRLFTWLVNLAKNTAIDAVRNKHYIAYGKTESLTNTSGTSNDVLEIPNRNHYNVDCIGVRKLVTTLTAEHQEILDLFYYKGFTQTEIAEKLGLPLGTVKTKIRQAVLKLRLFFQE